MNIVLATVVAVEPDLKVKQQTAATPVSAKRLSSYTPRLSTADDPEVVAIIQVAGTVLILGKVV